MISTSIFTCTRAIFQDSTGDLAQVDDLACFGGDEVERAVGDFDEAVETDASGCHVCEPFGVLMVGCETVVSLKKSTDNLGKE